MDKRLRAHLTHFHEPCPGCGYDLHALTSDRCPECGRRVSLEELIVRSERTPPMRSGTMIWALALPCLLVLMVILAVGFIAGGKRGPAATCVVAGALGVLALCRLEKHRGSLW